MQKINGLMRLIRRSQLRKGALCLALALAFIETAAALWAPMLTRDLVNGFGPGGLPWRLTTFLALVLVIQAFFGGLSLYFMGLVGHAVVANLRKHLHAHILRLPVKFHDQNRSGELASRVLNDTAILKDLVTDQLVHFVYGTVMVFGSVIILWLLDWKMTLVLFGSVIVATAIIVPIAGRLQWISKMVQDETASLNARAGQSFAEIRLVKASVAEETETKIGDHSIDRLFGLNMKETKIQAVMGPVMAMALMGALIAILGFGGTSVASGSLSIGDLVAFILYLFHIVMPLVQMTYFFSDLQKAIGASERITGLLAETTEESEGAAQPPWTKNALVLEDIRFSYLIDRKPVLRGVNMEIMPGSVTALVGPSGCGKSTIFSLIERFYAAETGTMMLGGKPITDFELPAWRKGIGYVAQESPILNGTIRDNLVFGLMTDPDEQTIWQALDAAFARVFVEELPCGLSTETGERGVRLSGGQRQRLAIARAILKDPEFLMLDEATANLDSDSERMVRSAIRNLMTGRTTLVIAHRLSTVMNADQIYVLEQGKISGCGAHAQLLETHRLYQQMVAQQFQAIEE